MCALCAFGWQRYRFFFKYLLHFTNFFIKKRIFVSVRAIFEQKHSQKTSFTPYNAFTKDDTLRSSSSRRTRPRFHALTNVILKLFPTSNPRIAVTPPLFMFLNIFLCFFLCRFRKKAYLCRR